LYIIKEKLLKEANEIIEVMEYFKSFIDKIPEDKIDLDTKFYNIEMDLKMFKNKFKKK
jgi:hypothetical protein